MTLAERHSAYLRGFGTGASAVTPDRDDLDDKDFFAGWRTGFEARETAGLAYAVTIEHKEYVKLFRLEARKHDGRKR